MQAIKSGEPLSATMLKLKELFAPYVGDVVDEKVVTPARLETIVRTNITEAYNQGRLAQLHAPDMKEFIQGVRYSAILDSRTTEICKFLHNKVFEEGQAQFDRIAPPNHFNCRYVIVPVLIDEDVDEFSNAETIKQATGLVKAGFGGDVAELAQFKEVITYGHQSEAD